jgi:hypothetical protein
MSQDHRLDSAWFGAGAGLNNVDWNKLTLDCLSLDSDFR